MESSYDVRELSDVKQLGMPRTDRNMLKYFFDTVLRYPQHLITHNSPVLQKAYVMVPADIWGERCGDLTLALQSSHADERIRRVLVTGRAAGMSPEIDEILDAGFLDKYTDLMSRVTAFNDFFPYKVARSNQKLMIFERLAQMELIDFVMKRL